MKSTGRGRGVRHNNRLQRTSALASLRAFAAEAHSLCP